MNYKTTNDISREWNISSRRITVLCNEGRVQGATKMGNTWLIPEDAQKPADNRKSRANSIKENGECDNV